MKKFVGIFGKIVQTTGFAYKSSGGFSFVFK